MCVRLKICIDLLLLTLVSLFIYSLPRCLIISLQQYKHTHTHVLCGGGCCHCCYQPMLSFIVVLQHVFYYSMNKLLAFSYTSHIKSVSIRTFSSFSISFGLHLQLRFHFTLLTNEFIAYDHSFSYSSIQRTIFLKK